MIRIMGRKYAWAALAYVTVCALTLCCVDRAWLIIVLNGLFLGMTISLTTTLLPLIWRAVRDHSFDEISQLTFSIVLMWSSLIMLRGNNAYARHYDLGGPTGNNISIPLSIYFAAGGAILQISAPGMIEWKSPRQRRIIALTVAAGLVIAALTVWYQCSGDIAR